MMKRQFLATAVWAMTVITPVWAQDIPAVFQGKWVSAADGKLGAAQLRQHCRASLHDESILFLAVGSKGFTLTSIGSEIKADRLRLSTRNDNRLVGTVRAVTTYDDESVEHTPNRRLAWRLEQGLLHDTSDPALGRLVFQRCAR